MRLLAGVAAAFGALALPALAQTSPVLLAAAQRLPAAAQLEPIARAASCVFAAGVRHLDPLPAVLAWTRPEAIVVFAGLAGQPDGDRAALMRPTREVLARVATREMIAGGAALLFDPELSPLPGTAPFPSFIAILVPAGTEAPASCTPRARH